MWEESREEKVLDRISHLEEKLSTWREELAELDIQNPQRLLRLLEEVILDGAPHRQLMIRLEMFLEMRETFWEEMSQDDPTDEEIEASRQALREEKAKRIKAILEGKRRKEEADRAANS